MNISIRDECTGKSKITYVALIRDICVFPVRDYLVRPLTPLKAHRFTLRSGWTPGAGALTLTPQQFAIGRLHRRALHTQMHSSVVIVRTQ